MTRYILKTVHIFINVLKNNKIAQNFTAYKFNSPKTIYTHFRIVQTKFNKFNAH